MSEFTSRSEMLLGKNGIEKLKNARILLFGVGGVGSYCCEALVRAGVGTIDIVDFDSISESNINRQILAYHSTIGIKKCTVCVERIKDINPDCIVHAFDLFLSADTIDTFEFNTYDYIIDAIDTVSSKLLLIKRCDELSVPVISCMGTGNKLDPSKFVVTDIYNTSGCPLARVMRHELKKIGIKQLKVVYSTEEPRKVFSESEIRGVPGSVSFVPPVAGFILAGEVIRSIAGVK